MWMAIGRESGIRRDGGAIVQGTFLSAHHHLALNHLGMFSAR